jgi:hypothetical protein
MSINYDRYLKVCRDATANDNLFMGFKSNPDYTWVLEHVSRDQGEQYLDEIGDCFGSNFMGKFFSNDMYGNPQTHHYRRPNRYVSPTTLRYIKVFADLRRIFGGLDSLNIVEIGGGYGGQCKIINDMYQPKSYTLVDLPDVLGLAEKYLNRLHVENVLLRQPTDVSKARYDLCLSNYAFTELDRSYQDFYVENIMKKSARGYLTCNFMDDLSDGRLSKQDLCMIFPTFEIFDEHPLTSPGNFIFTWKTL